MGFFDKVLQPIAGPILGLAGSLFGANQQKQANKAQQQFALKMYEKQKSDNMQMWQMQNEYNSPSSQMERLKQAGLNPNLVYGHGADAMAGQIKSADAPSYNPTAPKLDLANSLMLYNDLRMKDAQRANIMEQTNVAKQQARAYEAQTARTNAETANILPLRARNLFLENAFKENTQLYNEDILRYRSAEARAKWQQPNPNEPSHYFQNILTGQVLDNLYKSLRNANTQLERNMILGQIDKIKNENIIGAFESGIVKEQTIGSWGLKLLQLLRK